MHKKIIFLFTVVFFIISFCNFSFGKIKPQENINKDTSTSNLDLEKKPYQFYLEEASNYFSNGKPKEAEASIKKGLSFFSDNQELQMVLKELEALKNGEISEKLVLYLSNGIFYLSTKKYEKAITEFKKGQKSNPDHPSTFLCLGISQLFLKDFYKAKNNLLKAKSLYEKANDTLGITITEKYIRSISYYKNKN